jgi:radical SAM superfamily enzyme YgiQ (UPF0313 family)
MNNKVILISGDIPHEITVDNIMEYSRLRLGGVEASAEFLAGHIQQGSVTEQAAEPADRKETPLHILANGIYLYQYLTARGFEVELVHVFSAAKSQLQKLLQNEHLAVVISTTFLCSTNQINEIARFVKIHSPGSLVVAGGIYIWKSYRVYERWLAGELDEFALNEARKNDFYLAENFTPEIDVFINNEKGEFTLVNLLNKLQKGEPYREMANLAYYGSQGAVINTLAEEPHEFMGEMIVWNRLPFRMKNAEYPITAGTGCNMRCEFCDFINLREFQNRSVASIITEIETITPENGIRKVFFTNDNFLYSKKRIREMCTEMISRELNVKWRAFLRIDVIDEETAQLMSDSGCVEVLLGIESGDADVLRNMNKRITPEKIVRGLNALNKIGINTISTYVIGFPGETSETIGNTIDLINSLDTSGPGFHNYSLFTFCLYPLSPVASKANRLKYSLTGYMNNWEHATMNIREAVVQTKRLIDSIKSEISPIYWESPVIPGLTNHEQKRFYFLRNELAKQQRGVPVPGDVKELQQEFEQLIGKITISPN